MNEGKKIRHLIKRGEDVSLDFKKRITNSIKIARTIVSFANTEGGDIVVGVDDFGEVHRIDLEQEKYMLIKAAKNHCVPPIYLYFEALADKDDEILIVHVRKAKQEHFVKDEKGDLLPYVRVKDQSIVAPHADSKSNYKPGSSILIFSEEDREYLIQYLQEKKYVTIADYMKMMKISFPVAKKSLDHLKETGVLKEEIIKRNSRYSLN